MSFPLFVLALAAGLWSQPSLADPAKRIDELLPRLSSSAPAVLEQADRELEAMCLAAARPGAEDERRAVAAALAARLGPETPAGARELLVRQLQAIGRDEAVPALARLLGEEGHLRDAARRALEANPASQALRALRKAYPASSGEFRLALINSLGVRRDSLSVGDLLVDAQSEEVALRLTALDALARIGDRAAVDIFEEALARSGPEAGRLELAYLRLAESMSEGDEGGAARRIYLQALQLGPTERCAGLIGLGRTGLPADVSFLLGALGDPDPRVRGAARDGLAALRGATRMIGAKLETAALDLRKDLVEVLGRRGDPAAAQFLLKAMKDPEEGVRLAALEALGRTGGEGAIQALLAHLGEANLSAREVAERALRSLPGDEAALSSMASALPGAPKATRAALVRILGALGGSAADHAVERAAGDAEAAVRAEAYRALGKRGENTAAPVLLEALKKEEGEALRAAARALSGLSDPVSTRAILKALPGSPPPRRAAMIEALAGRSGLEVAEALKAAARDPDPGVRLSGLHALGRAGDESALPILLEAASGEGEEVRSAAIRGALRIAELKAKQGDLEGRKAALGTYLLALERAPGTDEKRIALRGLGEVGGAGAIEKIRPHLREGPLRRDAGRSAVRLGSRLPREEAIHLFEEILQSDPDPATARECVSNLRSLGVEREKRK